MTGRNLHMVADCIGYLRDRASSSAWELHLGCLGAQLQVGSPRDLSMPAAKILRAHLAEVVRQLKA